VLRHEIARALIYSEEKTELVGFEGKKQQFMQRFWYFFLIILSFQAFGGQLLGVQLTI
jgi:hypothetical protein